MSYEYPVTRQGQFQKPAGTSRYFISTPKMGATFTWPLKMLYKRRHFSPCGRAVTKTPNSVPARERLELCLIATLHPDMFELFRLSLRVHAGFHYCLQCSGTTRMESGTNAVYTHQSDSRLFVPTRVHSY